MDFSICVDLKKKLEITTNGIILRKTRIFKRFGMDYRNCVDFEKILSSTQFEISIARR